ncbi:MAG: hypothetical protein ABI614_22670 [Planctomycetota bacterium]
MSDLSYIAPQILHCLPVLESPPRTEYEGNQHHPTPDNHKDETAAADQRDAIDKPVFDSLRE